ncbi:hypothetical protein RR48_13664 [Papilio machaon]|uniref:Uncharacterized protein n=1 Tax=Papilio machaon TaxID=76193 RepID=A0A194RG64_PAPMA|nr:hypothetical protein RR48_13664 [Papilio machaon]
MLTAGNYLESPCLYTGLIVIQFIFACFLALAAAKPGVLPVAYTAPVAAAYTAPVAAAYTAPLAYSAYSAYTAPVAAYSAYTYASPYAAYYLRR